MQRIADFTMIEMMTVNAVITILALMLPLSAAQADDAAAEQLARKSNCLKCHGIDKKKDGPSLKEIAAKYKGKPDATSKMTTQMTTTPKVKIDGVEEEHPPLKAKNPDEVANVVRWILSR